MPDFLVDRARETLNEKIQGMLSEWVSRAVISQNYTKEMQICSLCDYAFSYKKGDDEIQKRKKIFKIDELLGKGIRDILTDICKEFNGSMMTKIDELKPPPEAQSILSKADAVPWPTIVQEIERTCDGFNYSVRLNRVLDEALLLKNTHINLHGKEFKSVRKNMMKSNIIAILQQNMTWDLCKLSIAGVVHLKIGDMRLKDALHDAWKNCSWHAWQICAEAMKAHSHDSEKMAEALIVLTLLLVTPYNHQAQYPDYKVMFQLYNNIDDELNTKAVSKLENLKQAKSGKQKEYTYESWLAIVNKDTTLKQARQIMPWSYPNKNDKEYAKIKYRIQATDDGDMPVQAEPHKVVTSTLINENLAENIMQALGCYSAIIRDDITTPHVYANFLTELSFAECKYAIMIYDDHCKTADKQLLTQLFEATSKLLPHVRFVKISKSATVNCKKIKSGGIKDFPAFFIYDDMTMSISSVSANRNCPKTLANNIDEAGNGTVFATINTQQQCIDLVQEMKDVNVSYAIMLAACHNTDNDHAFAAAAAQASHIRFVQVVPTGEFTYQYAVKTLRIKDELDEISTYYFVYNRWMEINRLYDIHKIVWGDSTYKIRKWAGYMNPRLLTFNKKSGDDKLRAIELYDNHERWWNYMYDAENVSIRAAKDAAPIVSRVVVERAFGSLDAYIPLKEGYGIYAIDDEPGGGITALRVIQSRNWWKTMARQLGCFYRNVPFTLLYASMMNNTCFDILIGKQAVLDKDALKELYDSKELDDVSAYGKRWKMLQEFHANLRDYVNNDGILKEREEWFDEFNNDFNGKLNKDDAKPILRCIPPSPEDDNQEIRLVLFKSFPTIHKEELDEESFEGFNKYYHELGEYE